MESFWRFVESSVSGIEISTLINQIYDENKKSSHKGEDAKNYWRNMISNPNWDKIVQYMESVGNFIKADLIKAIVSEEYRQMEGDGVFNAYMERICLSGEIGFICFDRCTSFGLKWPGVVLRIENLKDLGNEFEDYVPIRRSATPFNAEFKLTKAAKDKLVNKQMSLEQYLDDNKLLVEDIDFGRMLFPRYEFSVGGGVPKFPKIDKEMEQLFKTRIKEYMAERGLKFVMGRPDGHKTINLHKPFIISDLEDYQVVQNLHAVIVESTEGL